MAQPHPEEDVAMMGGQNEEMNEESTAGHKRTLDDHHVGDDGAAASAAAAGLEAEDDPAKKRRKKTIPPPKKLNNEQWDTMFERLVQYKDLNGHTMVPKRYEQDKALGTWVETQRQVHRKLERLPNPDGTESNQVVPNKRLNPERLQRLESIGFVWSARNVKKIKASPSPDAVVPPGPRAKKPPIAADKLAARAAARQRQNEASWQDMYKRLVAYKEKYGNCLVPKKFEEDQKLASWVEAQRIAYNRGYRVNTKPNAESKTTGEQQQPPPLPDPVPVPSPARVGVMNTPEEWVAEMGKADTATAEDAAELAATMAEATMEVVDEVAAAAAASQGGLVEDETASPVKKLTEEHKKMLDEIGFVWSLRSKKVDDHWEEMYRQLVEYKEQHGDCLVPSRYEPNQKLGKWIETQRYEMTKLQRATEGAAKQEGAGDGSGDASAAASGGSKARSSSGRLTDERIQRLDVLGFQWKVKNKMRRYYDRQWDVMFDKLLKFKEEKGHCLVPKRYPEDQRLATWVHTQRIQYRRRMSDGANAAAKKDSQEENADLESSARPTASAKKDSQDENAELEPSAHPTSAAKKDGQEENAELEPAARLTEERFRRLENIGFVWAAREERKGDAKGKNSYDEQWDTMYERLKAYKEKHGHVLVPKRCTEDPKLGTWVDTQRVSMKKMRKQLVSQDGDGIKVEPGAESPTTSDAPSETAFVDPSTGVAAADPSKSTVASLAGRKQVGRLTLDRIAKLESLGFIWSLRDDWLKHYNELKEFKREFNHCNVPARYAPNRKLGIWVSAQRQQYKLLGSDDPTKRRRANPLTNDRIALLNELDFTWTIRSRDSLGESWNQRLEELKEYKEEHGNTLVPSRYPPNEALGVWVGTQRTQYRLYMKTREHGDSSTVSSAMTADRIRQLEELGFVWTLRTNAGDSTWKKRISDLEEFRSMHGHALVPRDYPPNRALAVWVADMRSQYRQFREGQPSTLDDGRVAELENLGFSWNDTDNLEPLPVDTGMRYAGREDAAQVDMEGTGDIYAEMAEI